MKVCIAEKPSVARDLAKVLGANTARKGYIEGNGYQITWTFGHFCTLKEPHEYEAYLKTWHLDTLPIIPQKFGISLISNQGAQEQFNVIKELVESPQCEEVINCGDAGQEGELIQRWVLLKAGNKKPVKRLWISSLTEEAIKDGFQKLKDEKHYDNLYAAGTARAIGDWLLGINATRLFTLKYAPAKQVLSIGRVQTPTLALIVNRQDEINNFVPETYFELKTNYRDVLFSSAKGKITTKEKAEEFKSDIENSPFVVTSFSIKKGKEAPQKLFDLTSLQVECNKKFSLSAEETLKTVQSLYEKKLVTYPRVDTQYLPDDMYPKIAGIMRGMSSYSKYTEALLSKKIIKPKRIFDNSKITDHHAIIPTGVNPGGLSNYEYNVYDIISRRFIAAFYPDAVISNTLVQGEVKKIKFKATGRQVLEENWKILFKNEVSTQTEEDSSKQLMPKFEKGESGEHKPEIQDKKTSPPKYFTEATLLRAMESAGKQVDDDELKDMMKENGIGRPSTRAAIIETLFRRKYIVKNRKRLEATATGIALIRTIKNEILKSVELTGQWEKKLRLIEKGEYSVEDFKDEMIEMLQNLSYEVKTDNLSNLPEKQALADNKKKITCPKCQEGHLLEGKNAYGCSNYNKGCNFVIPFDVMGKKLSERQVEKLCFDKKSDLLKGFDQNGSKKNGYLVLTADFNLEFEEEVEIISESKNTPANKGESANAKHVNKCPKCGGDKFLKGKTGFGCANYVNGCNYVVSFKDAGTDKLEDFKIL